MRKCIKYTGILLCISFIVAVNAGAQSDQFRFTVIPEDPRPGEPVTIGMTGPAAQAILLVGGRRLGRAQFVFILPENRMPPFMAAVLTIPSTAASGPAVIRLENSRGIVGEIPITIQEREFRSQTINITPSLNSILNDPDPARIEQANRLNSILTTTGQNYYHTGTFALPVNSARRTSAYAQRRVNSYPNGRTTTSIHEGIDFGVPTGTEVFACGRGRVMLAGMRIVTGNTVVIEHGPGIYSLYYHLDKVEVQEGTMVNTGDLIGLSGSTGFSTGPHLHWEIRINTEITDPDIFLTRPLLDKDQIISKLFY